MTSAVVQVKSKFNTELSSVSHVITNRINEKVWLIVAEILEAIVHKYPI